MPHLSIVEPSRFSPRQLFELVADVPSYPEFLPWCRAARITRRQSDTQFHAELVIAFKGFSESYVSQVTLHPPAAEHEEARIEVDMVQGPFHHLDNHWVLIPQQGGGTEIRLELDFQFKSKILEKLIGGLFEKASEKMVGAFRQRARELYGE